MAIPPRDRFLGCLLAGACGDALGWPVEFMSRGQIARWFGPAGITDFAVAPGGVGAITDDTQMTLFTAEGLLAAFVRGAGSDLEPYARATAQAYGRWLRTQGRYGHSELEVEASGFLFDRRELHDPRAPGNTCLSALERMRAFGEPARNDSKGCGGVMRMAPAGLFAHATQRLVEQDFSSREPVEQSFGSARPVEQNFSSARSVEQNFSSARPVGQSFSSARPVGQNFSSAVQLWTFDLGTTLAALTHGHPSGSLAAGALAVIVLRLVDGAPLPSAVQDAMQCLRARPHGGEVLEALDAAVRLAAAREDHRQALAALGEGWVAEEALALGVYCALVADDVAGGLVLAVNHDGDSDSTGAIAGNLLGAMLGVSAIPEHWLARLELRDTIAEVAADLHDCATWRDLQPDARAALERKYPSR